MNPINRAILCFMFGSIIFWCIFAGLWDCAAKNANTPSLNIYGDFERKVGRAVDQYQIVSRYNIEVENIGKMNLSVCYLPKRSWSSSLSNLQYDKTTLFVSINASKPIMFSLGVHYYSHARLASGDPLPSEFLGYNWNKLKKRWGFIASYAVISMPLEERLPSEWSSSYDFVTYSRSLLSQVHIYAEDWEKPCIFWNGTLKDVKFQYTEVWKFQPVVGHDDSTSIAGKGQTAFLAGIGWSVFVTEILLGVSLLSLWKRKE